MRLHLGVNWLMLVFLGVPLFYVRRRSATPCNPVNCAISALFASVKIGDQQLTESRIALTSIQLATGVDTRCVS
jgi:hypothetical protein